MPVIELSEPRVYNLPYPAFSPGIAYTFPLLNGIDVAAFGCAQLVLRVHSGSLNAGSSYPGSVYLTLAESAPTDADPPLTKFQANLIGNAAVIGGSGSQVATGFANLRSSHVNASLVFFLPSTGGQFNGLSQIVISAELVLRHERDQWTPAVFSSSKLKLWTDHRDQTIVSGTVSAWGDESGNGNNLTQGVQNNQPTLTTLNGWSAPLFAPGPPPGPPYPRWLSASTGSLIGTTGYHGFAVISPAALPAPGANIYNDPPIFADSVGNPNPWYGISLNSNGITAWHYSSGYLNTPYSSLLVGLWYLIEWSYDGTAIRCRVNSAAPTSVAAGSVGSVSNAPGVGHGNANSGYFSGTIASLLVFNQFLVANDANTVRAYLSSKYGVAA